MFNPDSIVVRSWVSAINKGDRTFEEVPNILNLRDVVHQAMEGGGADVQR